MKCMGMSKDLRERGLRPMSKLGYIKRADSDGPDSPALLVMRLSDATYREEPSINPAGSPSLNRLIADIGEGDALVTASFSELAGSSQAFLQIAGVLQSKGAHLICLKEGIDTSTEDGKAVIRALMSLKELDEASMVEWTKNRVDYIKRNASPKHQIGKRK